MAFGNGFRGPGAHRKPKAPQSAPKPKAGPATRDGLKLLLGSIDPNAAPPIPRAKASKPGRQPGEMNKTETKYARVLDERRAAGEVAAWWYESVTLKLAPSTHYRPDFLVMLADGSLEVHEVKGGFVQEDAWIKTKVAAAMFPFRFVVAQWRGRQWNLTEL